MLVRLTRDLMAQYKSVLINYTTDSVPSVLWCCWLGGRKGIRPVKNWVVRCWCGYLSGARCRLAHGPADATAMPKMTRLVVPFLYRLKRVVLDKGPLNGCVCIYDRLLTDWRYGDSAGTYHWGELQHLLPNQNVLVAVSKDKRAVKLAATKSSSS